ncbi:MAG: hypothetical protein L0323_06335 [Planctomycetes bacterium]|nr:hypothetical protein [Planctomycetota bacterium]
MRRTDLISQGDRDLAESLLAEPRIRAAVESFEKLATDLGARRQLLGTALRLTPEAAPDVHATVETCRTTLGLEMPVETYVYPGPVFNAGSVRPESGRLFVILSSSLLEAFESDEPLRSDWFASHPFNPLRLRAAELFARSDGLAPGGLSRADLEARVQDLMTLMDPGYLRERSDEAEAMRRLLFAGGIAIAAASGTVSAAAVEALERLLGPGSVSSRVDPARIREDLPSRIEAVRRLVPPLRRAQVIRDLCLIVRADRQVTEAERRVLFELADAVGVDRSLVACTVEESSAPHGTEAGP